MSESRWYNFEGTPDGWLSYWGGILGSGLGVFGSLLVLREQINIEKVDNTFFNLLNIHNDIIKSIRNMETNNSIFDRAYHSMSRSKEQHLNLKEQEILITFIINKKSYYFDAIKKMRTGVEKLENTDVIGYYLYGKEFYKIQIEELREFLQAIYLELIRDSANGNNASILIHLNFIYNVVFINDRYSSVLPYLRDDFVEFLNLYNDMYMRVNYQFDETSKNEIVELGLRDYYGELGNYFRTFHRIIKFINENVKDMDAKANYIGFLRAMINEKEMIVIFYNAFHSSRGKGLADQLKYTDFFGTSVDLPLSGDLEAQHFNKKLLLWENSDIEKMNTLKLQRMPRKTQKRIMKILNNVRKKIKLYFEVSHG
jgi:hypothetical protein